MSIYHTETQRIYDHLQRIKHTLVGSTSFTLADLAITINGKDGLGGLIEEWFGVWAENEGYQIINPKKEESSQTFPDYYVGNNCDGYQYLEIKTFDADASANFDIANFQSYCASLAEKPDRVYADYLIFSYRVTNGILQIVDIFLKKIWEITCPSETWPLKNQNKRGVIYNIRPSNFRNPSRSRYQSFSNANEFIEALFATEEQYLGRPSLNRAKYLKSIQQP